MEASKASYGSRIKFDKDGQYLISKKIFANGLKMVRIIIDTEKFSYKLVDPVTNETFKEESGWSNLEVVQRNAKAALKEFLKIEFDKESRG